MAKDADETGSGKAQRSSCPISGTLELLGDRWSLLVIRDVMFFDSHTFGELQGLREGIASNILTDRLRRLVADGILEKRPYQENPPRYAYHLTAKGKSLRPVLTSLARWGLRHVPGAERPVTGAGSREEDAAT